MARFWIVALQYVESSPPEGWATWEDWLREFEVPESEWNDGAAINDPDGVLPKVGFLKVPEGKVAKNRLHIDLNVSGGRHVAAEIRVQRIEAFVESLVSHGARIIERGMHATTLDHVVMADPEGNEFCVV
jgi:Glyoxalase-like domain